MAKLALMEDNPMIAKGQGAEARARRLSLGCCPIQGVSMYQETPYLDGRDAELFGFYGQKIFVWSVALEKIVRYGLSPVARKMSYDY